jgi:hypothetical protein
VSYDLLLWKQRSTSEASPAFLYVLVCEDVEVPDIEDLDLAELEVALDHIFTNWRAVDAPFTCDFARNHLAFSVWFSKVEVVVPALRDLARSRGLTLFDPQVEPVPSTEARRAKRIAQTARRQEWREQEASEVAALAARAEAGDPDAQLQLGNKLSVGEGIRKSLRTAFQWYRSAAEGGCTDAMFNLAACYQYGDGVRRDLAAAVRWYEKASERDRTYATFALGVIYLGCGPIARDNIKAAGYFQEALAHGHPDAAAALRLLCEPEITLEMKKMAWKFWTLRE